MRKQTKLIAALSATALLALGASMTSFAASGWQEENGVWMWYDNNGDYVTDTWKKSGTQYFYLDENGEMATNMVVETDDNKYYVDANGARVINQWVAVPNEDDWDEEVDTIYYYFGSSGKAYTGRKTINGKTYIFDDEGHMYSGWHTYSTDAGKDYLYYLGGENEGWAYTGWQSLEPSEDMTNPTGEDYDDEEWFWFKTNGQAVVDKRQYINGHYYAFDSNGVMMDKWLVGTPGAPTASPTSAYYTEDIGNQQTGWIYTYAKGDDNQDGEQYWYYLSNKGVPYNMNADSGTTVQKYVEDAVSGDPVDNVNASRIKSKTYLFNGDGQLLTGVYELQSDTYRKGSTNLKAGIYYFNKNDGSVNGQMMTGKQTVSYDGENYYYNFAKDGKAYVDAIVDGTLYGPRGARIQADEGKTPYTLENPVTVKINSQTVTIPANSTVIINASGKVTKSSKKLTIDGESWTIKDYVAEPYVESK